jgi:hypothetical protein
MAKKIAGLVRMLSEQGISDEKIDALLDGLSDDSGSQTSDPSPTTTDECSYGAYAEAMRGIIGKKDNLFSTRMCVDAVKKLGSRAPDMCANLFLKRQMSDGKIERTSRGHYRTRR